MRISSSYRFVDYVSVFHRDSQHELVGLVWKDVEGEENFPVSAGFELIATQPPHTIKSLLKPCDYLQCA